MSNRKCAYCETLLSEESKYMEVEHYRPKNIYPDLVVEWTNLLPSCKGCNGKKSDYDTGIFDFVHPVDDNPKDHLTIHLSKPTTFVRGIDEKGKHFVRQIGLNDYDRLRKPRIKAVYDIIKRLEDIHDLLTHSNLQSNSSSSKKIQRKMTALLSGLHPRSNYSAYKASAILKHSNWQKTYNLMVQNNLWNEYHHRLLSQARQNVLPST